ncbi:MAG: PEBP family protein [candidate division TA06 bacterium 32_111]|nr:MAG: PEBP family protein [candidate division TA06 bacterium 32_111]HCP16597.1 YbhB/YbcL family Raf kinase inhibitor-like protein [candidate division WOR-3 bacterium]
MKNKVYIFFLLFLLFFLLGCKTDKEVSEKKELEVFSDFENYSLIPEKFSYKGGNISPVVRIRNIPSETKSLVLIVEDPDAPFKKFIHWILFNIPPFDSIITEGISKNSFKLEDGILQGLNSLGEYTYFGPNPPSGTHRYFFKVYAIDTFLLEDSTLTYENILKMIENHIISYGELVGKYSKK